MCDTLLIARGSTTKNPSETEPFFRCVGHSTQPQSYAVVTLRNGHVQDRAIFGASERSAVEKLVSEARKANMTVIMNKSPTNRSPLLKLRGVDACESAPMEAIMGRKDDKDEAGVLNRMHEHLRRAIGDARFFHAGSPSARAPRSSNS